MLDTTLLKDVAERAIATALQTFVALYVVGDMSSLKTAAVAGVAAGLSVLKGVVASAVPFGDKSASVVDAGYETEVVKIVEVPVVPPKKKVAKKVAPAKKAVK
jgi:hypothetical protein